MPQKVGSRTQGAVAFYKADAHEALDLCRSDRQGQLTEGSAARSDTTVVPTLTTAEHREPQEVCATTSGWVVRRLHSGRMLGRLLCFLTDSSERSIALWATTTW